MNGDRASVTSFRHLCRSSPWRWTSLRFQLHFRPSALQQAAGAAQEPVRCWVRRPGALRVETLTGTLVAGTPGINASKGAEFISGSRKPWLLPPYLVTPVYDDDGLVVRRPEAAYGEPVYVSGRFAAALDPVELAGPAPVAVDNPFANVADIQDVTELVVDGRPTLAAVLSPTTAYRPQWPQAPLLHPGRTAVQIDVATGVCVASRSLDGDTSGSGHALLIQGVDEYMLDDLFEEAGMGLTDVGSSGSWTREPDA